MNYPKVLIIGQYFDKKSGGGITLSNLFHGWDKKNIAVASVIHRNPDFSVCENYYSIGPQEINRGFPFNFKSNETGLKSGRLVKTDESTFPVFEGSNKISKVQRLKDYLLLLTGQIHRRRSFVISQELFKWINDFSPEVLYTQLSSLEEIKFIRILHSKINKPLVIHMMDDWPVTITNPQKGLFQLYWSKIIDKELKQLIPKASVLMSISESMSEAYYSRYGRRFIPFHNPIEIERWKSFSRVDCKTNSDFKVLYTGRIGTANNKSLNFISKVISTINVQDIKILFDIYTPESQTAYAEMLNTYRGVSVKSSLPYEEIPGLLSSYDLLVLPLDFDRDGIRFAKYSMPTKSAEYMISGTPILVFASMETALAKYAVKEGWAYVVSENESKLLTEALYKLKDNEVLRTKISKQAIKVATLNENAVKVREEFRKSFIIK